MSSPIRCISSMDKYAECTMCTNRKGGLPSMIFWEIRSNHPQRNVVIVLCDECMDQLCGADQ